MFDITWFVKEKIFRIKPKKENIVWEELTEKQTTKMWYFLLFLMFFAILWSAYWSLDIIRWMVQRPTPVPYCVEKVLNAFESKYSYYWYYYGYNDCQLVSYKNPKFDFTKEYNKILPWYKNIEETYSKIDDLKNSIRSYDRNYYRIREDYNTSLLEKTAWKENKVFDADKIANSITKNREQILKLEEKIKRYHQDIQNIKAQYKSEYEALKKKYEKAKKDYNYYWLVYKFKVALLSILFIWLLFTIFYKLYSRAKEKNSPYTIIFSVSTFAYWLVLLHILFRFVWDLIPHKFIEWLSNLFLSFKPLLYLVQFLYPVIIVWIFGFLVYKIQKRLYSPENVLKRIIKDKKCPWCWSSIDYTKKYCPLCSYQILTKCKNCWEYTIKWLKYCYNCWKNLKDN